MNEVNEVSEREAWTLPRTHYEVSLTGSPRLPRLPRLPRRVF